MFRGRKVAVPDWSRRSEAPAPSAKRDSDDQSVIDLVLDEASRLRKDLGSADKHRLEEYLHSVRTVERRVQLVEDLQRLAAADARSWDDAARITREVDAERAASTNGIPRIAGRWLSGDGFYSMLASFRERRAQLRLLRVAAHFRATGDLLESEDPFGGMLIHNVKEGRLKVWSRGRDAVDDGGSGAGKDIVLEVTR
jgi:hypothetical protein